VSPSPVDRNTALLEIITEGARAVMLDRNVYAECNQHLTAENRDLWQKLRAAEDQITVLQQQLDQERAER
jgi:hypothetical protein